MAKRTCSISGCDGAYEARGWCKRHYRRWQTYGDPEAPTPPPKHVRGVCTVEDCKKPHSARGFCKTHYTRWRRHRDPNQVNPANWVRPRPWLSLGIKPCTKCGQIKPFSEFSSDATKRDGLSSACAACLRTAARAYTSQPEVKARRYDKDQTPEARARKRTAAARYRKRQKLGLVAPPKPPNRSPESVARHRRSQAAYRKTLFRSASLDRYQRSEKGRLTARRNQERRRFRSQPEADGRTIQYVNILRKDPCSYCGRPCEHIDHIDALAVGGTGAFDNLTAACAECNRRKQTKPLLLFLLSVNG